MRAIRYHYCLLNSKIDGGRKIYVEMPHGFGDKNTVCLLLRALYGLKQSPYLWYEELRAHLQTLDFLPCLNDICVFRHTQSGVMIVIYVDDMLVIAKTKEQVDRAAQLLQNKFKMRSLGPIHYYLGMRIIRDRPNRELLLLQDSYMERLAQQYKFVGSDFYSPATPMPARHGLRKAAEDYTADNNLKERY
jgi:hypothetical protein